MDFMHILRSASNYEQLQQGMVVWPMRSLEGAPAWERLRWRVMRLHMVLPTSSGFTLFTNAFSHWFYPQAGITTANHA